MGGLIARWNDHADTFKHGSGALGQAVGSRRRRTRRGLESLPVHQHRPPTSRIQTPFAVRRLIMTTSPEGDRWQGSLAEGRRPGPALSAVVGQTLSIPEASPLVSRNLSMRWARATGWSSLMNGPVSSRSSSRASGNRAARRCACSTGKNRRLSRAQTIRVGWSKELRPCAASSVNRDRRRGGHQRRAEPQPGQRPRHGGVGSVPGAPTWEPLPRVNTSSCSPLPTGPTPRPRVVRSPAVRP